MRRVADVGLTPMVHRMSEVTLHSYFYFVAAELLKKQTGYIRRYTKESRQSVLTEDWWHGLPELLEKKGLEIYETITPDDDEVRDDDASKWWPSNADGLLKKANVIYSEREPPGEISLGTSPTSVGQVIDHLVFHFVFVTYTNKRSTDPTWQFPTDTEVHEKFVKELEKEIDKILYSADEIPFYAHMRESMRRVISQLSQSFTKDGGRARLRHGRARNAEQGVLRPVVVDQQMDPINSRARCSSLHALPELFLKL